jgi:integrase
MKFYTRNGILYVRKNRMRISTKLTDTKENRKLFESYAKNDKFFEKFDVKKDNAPTILDLCEEVLNEKSTYLKKTSLKAYNSLYHSRIVPYFDNILVTEFKPKDVFEWYKTIHDKRTIVTCEAILKPAFEKAILYEYIETSPFIIKRPKTNSEYTIMPFSISEINKIIEISPNRVKNLIAIAFYSGMRTGEVIGLKWEDINFLDKTISVQRTITSGIEQTPKTKSSCRVIDMITQCENHLLEQRKFTGLGEYIFLSSDLKPYRASSSLNYTWKKILKEANIEYRSIYQLRHSFASNMLSNGENELWVAQMMGHKSSNTTRTKYSKYLRVTRNKKITFLDSIDTKIAQSF